MSPLITSPEQKSRPRLSLEETKVLEVLVKKGAMTPSEISVKTLMVPSKTWKCLRNLAAQDLLVMREDYESADGWLVAITGEGFWQIRQ